MFIKDYKANPVKGTKKVKIDCPNCDNEAEHQVYEDYYGPQIGIIFMKKPLISKKRYFLVCPICGNVNKQISKEQVKSLKKKN